MIEFIHDRGEAASAIAVVLALLLSAPAVARLLGTPRRLLSDAWWYGGIAFAAVGRLAFVARADAGSLTDPLVVVRITDGIEPLWGAAAALGAVWAVVARRHRGGVGEVREAGGSGGWTADQSSGRPAVAGWATALTIAGFGLLVAAIASDLACPLRDACYGRTAPEPWGFRMAGLADARLATPLWEAAVLAAGAGLLVARWPHLHREVRAALPLGLVVGLRLGFIPLSARGWVGWSAEAVLLAVALGALVTLVGWTLRRRSPPPLPQG